MGKKSPKGRKSGGSPKTSVASPPKLSPTEMKMLASSFLKRHHSSSPINDNIKKSKNTNSSVIKPAIISTANQTQVQQSLTKPNSETLRSSTAREQTQSNSPANPKPSATPTPAPVQQPETKTRPPPPLIVPASAWRKTASKLMTVAPEEAIEVKAFHNNSVKIQCADADMFRLVQKHLKSTETDFFTYPRPEEKTLKVVIRGLTPDITEDELSDEIKLRGYEVKSVRQFIKAGRKLPLYMISLPSSPASKSIFNEHSIFYISIKVEPYRSTNPAQCFKCQKFGHSSLFCGFTPKCVKCAGSHWTKECTKTMEEAPKCSNCDGTHTANYKQCPVFLKSKAAKQASISMTKLRRTQPAVHPANPPVSSLTSSAPAVQIGSPCSYASALGSKVTQPPKDQPDYSTSQATIQMLTNLLTELTAGTANIKEALITTLSALIPLLITHNV